MGNAGMKTGRAGPATRLTGVRAGLCALLLLGSAGVHGASPDECRDPPVGTICDARSAARYLLHIAGELDAARQWCVALGADKVAWQVALDFWIRRNREYLDAAARIVSDGDIERFSLDGPWGKDPEPAIPVSEAQCGHDLRDVDEGRFDVDLVPGLRPLKRYLQGN